MTQTPRHFSKTVAIKATDDEERTATGVVLTTNELDRQLDFLDGDGVRAMFNPSPSDGVMHTKFPDDHAELTRNEVLDEDVARLSPLGSEHVGMLGRYHFELPRGVARGALRPLRDPDASEDGW